MTRFHVDDELLEACLAWRRELSSGTIVCGFHNSKNTIGYGLLVNAVRHALGIQRLPFHEDRILAKQPTTDMEKELKELRPQLTTERLAQLSAAVRRLYEHTQAQLSASGQTHVRLKRYICNAGGQFDERTNQADMLVRHHQAATVLGRPTVDLEMDVLNSFSSDGGYSRFPVCLALDVPAKDVIYCTRFIAGREGYGLRHPLI